MGNFCLLKLRFPVLCNFHDSKLENTSIKDLNAWFILMILCNYLGEGRGCTCAYIDMGHTVNIYYRTAWSKFTKRHRDEVLMAHTCLLVGFSRVNPRPGKTRSKRDFPFKKKPSFSYLRTTATNRMHSNDLKSVSEEALLFLRPFELI